MNVHEKKGRVKITCDGENSAEIKLFLPFGGKKNKDTIKDPMYQFLSAEDILKEDANKVNSTENEVDKVKIYENLVIQHYVWKNVESDFYGFCTEERLLRFSDKKLDEEKSNDGFYRVNSISGEEKLLFIDGESAKKMLNRFEIVSVAPLRTTEYGCANVKAYLLADFYHFDNSILTEIKNAIDIKFPQYVAAYDKYLKSDKIFYYNLWVAAKKKFLNFEEFQFGTLEALGESLDLENAGLERKKLFSILSSHLWGIYLTAIENEENSCKVKYVNGIFRETYEDQPVIEPAFPEKNVAIVFSSSNTFAPYLGVALQSMMETVSEDNNYDIIVLEKSISEEEKKRINDICAERQNVSLRFVNTRGLVPNVHFYVPVKSLSEETYYTVLVPWILEKYEKALVLDCDIIINHDLAELYNVDLTGKYLAAVKEIVFLGFLNNPHINVCNNVTDYITEKLGMTNPYDYFNAGVLLLNLNMFRKNHTMQELLDNIDKNKYNIVEQDLLNAISVGKVEFLSYSWNFMSCLTEPSMFIEHVDLNDTTICNLKLAPEKELQLYNQASQRPYIYHYLTRMKPWKYPFLKYADLWWSFARKTVWYETFLYQIPQGQKSELQDAVLDIQNRLGIFDNRSGARKLGDKLLPKGTRRRELAKKILPKGSKRWKFLKNIYESVKEFFKGKQ